MIMDLAMERSAITTLIILNNHPASFDHQAAHLTSIAGQFATTV